MGRVLLVVFLITSPVLGWPSFTVSPMDKTSVEGVTDVGPIANSGARSMDSGTVVFLTKEQNVTVKGITICNKKRLGTATVQLWEKDTRDTNHLLDEVYVDEDGEFKVNGVAKFEPFLRITHNCRVSKPDCVRISEYYVPESDDVYDMTYVILNIHTDGDEEHCWTI